MLNKSSKKLSRRISLLIFTPIVLIATASFNFLHFYILNGATLMDMKGAFLYRAARGPLEPWLSRMYVMLSLHATWLFVITAILGLVIFAFQYKKRLDWRVLTPLFLFPIFVAVVFFQWSTHPFGVIYLLPAVAVLSGIFFWFLIDKIKIWGILVVLIIFSTGIFYSLKNLDYFFNDFVILKSEDVELLKSFKGNIDHGEICLGNNQMGLAFNGISEWYLGKKVGAAPSCLENLEFLGKTRIAIIFHPGMGEFYLDEAQKFEAKGFKLLGCSGGFWCVIEKKLDDLILE